MVVSQTDKDKTDMLEVSLPPEGLKTTLYPTIYMGV
jgi:hypothetical protein